MALKPEEFAYVADLARSNAAIVLERGKEYLVETRLGPIARQEGLATLGELIGRLRAERTFGSLHARVVDALTTNETFFFRDFHPFEAVRKHVIPQLIEQRASVKRLTIWSGACSTGQEPYSLAMLLRDSFPQLRDWTLKILATDLSATVLAQAQAGRYTQLEVNRGLPAPLLIKYFEKREAHWFIKEDIRKIVEFKPMNLIQPWPIMPGFDLVFLRNVMIYFDVETKRSILRRMRGCLLPHGHLFLGTAETTMNLDSDWKPVPVGSTVAYQPLKTGE
jgi:chemotaxis protein methyltransferase CheR